MIEGLPIALIGLVTVFVALAVLMGAIQLIGVGARLIEERAAARERTVDGK